MPLDSETLSIYVKSQVIGRPPKPEHLRRSRMLPIRLTASELEQFEAAARRLGVSVADMMREGARLFIEQRGKDGHRKRKEKK